MGKRIIGVLSLVLCLFSAAVAREYKVEDVFAGIYHGKGGDYTAEMQAYVDLMIEGSEALELNGCVPLDARLAELLQMIMDKYTFEGVYQSWQKFCFYYDLMGPRK